MYTVYDWRHLIINADLTWLWVTLGILAGLVVIGGLAALAFGGFVVYSRSKHNREIYDTV